MLNKFALTFALVQQASATNVVQWTVAADKQGHSCVAVCNGLSMTCLPGQWPGTIQDLLRDSISSKLECSEMKVATAEQDGAPYVDQDNVCHYTMPYEGLDKTPSCKASVTGSRYRMCPCTKQGVKWSLALAGQSCTDFCRTRGGACGDQEDIWPADADSLNSVATWADVVCPTSGPYKPAAGTSAAAPLMEEADPRLPNSKAQCYFKGTQTPFCAAVPKKAERRFCACWGVESFGI